MDISQAPTCLKSSEFLLRIPSLSKRCYSVTGFGFGILMHFTLNGKRHNAKSATFENNRPTIGEQKNAIENFL